MKPCPLVVSRIIEVIRTSERICVAGHVRPDGDCIGSQLGLALALGNAGKRVACWNEDRVPPKLAFLDPDGIMQPPRQGEEFDCVFTLDVASFDRLGKSADCISARRWLVNIDHHASNTRFGDINWVSSRAPSTGDLIYRLLRYANWPITPRIADCLFTAITTDTGSFQYPTTRPATFVAAGELVKRGADVGAICREVYHSFPMSRVRLLRHMFNRFRLAHASRIAYVWLRQADYARAGAEKSETEGLIDHIRAIDPVIVAVVFEEMQPDLTRVSFRSKSPMVDVNQIAGLFGGGGHPAAAGARIQGKPMAVQRRVIGAIRKAIDSIPQSNADI